MRRRSFDTNRSVGRRANRTGYWCHYCDKAFIGQGQKCPKCGKKDQTKKKVDKQGDI